MSAIRLFPGQANITGFLDSWEPFLGWILADQEIVKVMYICGSGCYSLPYGSQRDDVYRKHRQNQSKIICSPNCGFKDTRMLPVDGFILVELKDGSLRKSRPLTQRDADSLMLDDRIPLGHILDHEHWRDMFIEKFNRPGIDILELGARRVSNSKGMKYLFDKANYCGFDISDGQDVDIVGDAHFLSEYLSKKFDLIISNAVFEHLAMPWRVAAEMIRSLKLGGHIFIETHYSYSSHERPWHFFQFSEKALEALFPASFGMKCLASGVSNPIRGRFSSYASPYLRERQIRNLYCHSEYFGKKVKLVNQLDWDRDTLHSIYNGTMYPIRPEKN